MTLRTLLLIALCAAAPLRAQTLTLNPVYNFDLPASHSYIIGLGTQGPDLTLFTIESYYTSPLYAGGSMVFTKSLDNFADFNLRAVPQSLALVNPLNANEAFLTGGLGAQNLLYTYTFSPPGQTNVAPTGIGTTKPYGLAADGAGAVYLDTAGLGGVSKYASAASTTPEFTFGLTGPGSLNAPRAMTFGPDGLLYVLDTGAGSIVSFNSDGVYQSSFSLANMAADSALAIDAGGQLFTENANGGGDIYDIYTGTHLGTIADTGDINIGPGKAQLAVAGQYLYATSGSGQSLYVYDLSAIPEPSTWALFLLGGMALFWRRHRSSISRQS